MSMAAALKGRTHLLDSYTVERHPVAARVLENTRPQVALLRPDALTSALRHIVTNLIKLPDGKRYIGEMLLGVDIRYDLGDDDPLVETLVGDRVLTRSDGSEERLYTLMTNGGGLFISPSERSLPPEVHHLRTSVASSAWWSMWSRTACTASCDHGSCSRGRCTAASVLRRHSLTPAGRQLNGAWLQARLMPTEEPINS